jgi:hypothetical protein
MEILKTVSSYIVGICFVSIMLAIAYFATRVAMFNLESAWELTKEIVSGTLK